MQKWRNGVFFVFLCGIILILAKDASAGRTVLLDKPKLRLSIPPGQTQTGKIEVKNLDNQPKKVRIYLEDWVYSDSSGSKKFMPASTAQNSAAGWITFSPQELQLPVKGINYVYYTVSVPAEAKGGHYAILFFEFNTSDIGTTATAARNTSVPLAVRVGTLFYVEPQGTINTEALLGKVSFSRGSQNEPLKISLEVKNSGNSDFIATGNFDLIDKEGMVLGRGIFSNQVYLQAQDVGELTGYLRGKIPAGKYDLIITLNLGLALEELGLGTGPILTREVEVEVNDKGEINKVGDLK